MTDDGPQSQRVGNQGRRGKRAKAGH